MSFEIVGVISEISEVLELNNGAKKILFRVDCNEEFNKPYQFELYKGVDHLEHIDNFLKYNKVGDKVTVEFNIGSNEWKDKVFTSLKCWKCTKFDQTTADHTPDTTSHLNNVEDMQEAENIEDDNNDLPF